MFEYMSFEEAKLLLVEINDDEFEVFVQQYAILSRAYLRGVRKAALSTASPITGRQKFVLLSN